MIRGIGSDFIFLFFLSICTCTTSKSIQNSDHFLPKIEDLLPSSDSCDQVVEHIGYTLCYSEKDEQARWVFYELTKEEVEKNTFKRRDDFRADTMIKTQSANLEDYKGSGYDRGHLFPAGDAGWSEESMSESFLLSNISPQVPSFNRGVWKRLEEMVRSLAVENEALYVVAGGVLSEANLPTIGKDSVTVPELFYKVVLDYTESEIKGIGFLIKNEGSKAPLNSFAVSIDSVESVTGIDFYSALPDSIEARIECRYDWKKWEK